eukprot:CAMPEP_0183398758 /NCGR_PEP_ID=MMETSP0370-20130417/11473_1 /TAXON_ID=268820 /ORGANISM="Peridinium aciculiferum, Strain PAER-2" /LENGTH=216 /DNA_ID=CAMNT_0025579811 /DNA_START=35 /DNA_END=681 /DNA_ORIENTATION=+
MSARSGHGAVLCIFFDFETTGLHLPFTEIVEIAAVARIFGTDGLWHDLPGNESATFRRLIKPSKKLPKKIQRLTGLCNELLEREGLDFRTALGAWTAWLRQIEHRAACAQGTIEVWMVGHNILAYDLPLLAAQDGRERRRDQWRDGGGNVWQAPPLFEGVEQLTGFVDTLHLSRQLAASGCFQPQGGHGLVALHSSIVGRPLASAHTALGDSLGVA